MSIRIVPHSKELSAGVEAFIRRMRAGGSSHGFYVDPEPDWIPKRPGQNVWREFYVAIDEQNEVHGGFGLKPQDWKIRGETQIVTGNGAIVANMDIEGTISPGNSIGTLTVTGNVSMFGSTVMELDNSGSPQNSDELNVSGNLTLGGALSLVNIGPGLVNGDTFDLFDGTISGSFSSIAYPSGTTAANWINNLGTTGSITFMVPEASTSLLSLAGGLLLMRRRRK